MGSKIHPDLVQSKLFFELVNEPFIGENEVKETENVHDNIEKEIDDEVDLRGLLSQVTGMDDHRSDDGESQKQLTWKGLTFAKKSFVSAGVAWV